MNNPTLNRKIASSINILESMIECRMAYENLPGMSVGLVYDQDLIWARGFGFRDVENEIEATTDTIYRIASISKVFTSTAIMILRDRGKLNLHDPVKKFLSWFDIESSFEDAPPVTIFHLLTHTSGIPREAPFPYWNDNIFPTREQMIEGLSRQKLCFPPGAQWKYSNLGMSIAGEVVEEVSEISYADFIEKEIFEPLGMISSSVNIKEDQKSRLATGYGRRMPDGTRNVMPFTESKGITPAANLSSTVEDLSKFISLQFRDGKAGGNQILKGRTLEEMQRVHWLQNNWQSGWGLGLSISRMNGHTICGHGGSVVGHRTEMRFCPEEKFGVIVLTNADGSNPDFYSERVFKHVMPTILNSESEEKKLSAPPVEWERLTGRYRNSWGDTEVILYNGGLAMISPLSDNPWDEIIRLVPESDNIFTMQSPTGHGSIGEEVIFECGTGGIPERIKVGDTYTMRINDWNDKNNNLQI